MILLLQILSIQLLWDFYKTFDNISKSDVTIKETESVAFTHKPTGIRKSSRPTVRPDRLYYDIFGFLNLINIWNQGTLLSIVDHIDYALMTINNKPR